MIKGAEKRGKVHTTPIAARERERELRQAQGSLVSGGSDDADESHERGRRRWSFSFVYQCALCIRSVRGRVSEPLDGEAVTPGGTPTWLVAYNSRCRPRGAIYWRRGTLDGATEDGITD